VLKKSWQKMNVKQRYKYSIELIDMLLCIPNIEFDEYNPPKPSSEYLLLTFKYNGRHFRMISGPDIIEIDDGYFDRWGNSYGFKLSLPDKPGDIVDIIEYMMSVDVSSFKKEETKHINNKYHFRSKTR
jgi:hypothetical protein